MKSHRDDRRKFAAPENPSGENGKKCFEAGEWRKPSEDANGHTSRNGVGRISKVAQMRPRFLQEALGIQLQLHDNESNTAAQAFLRS